MVDLDPYIFHEDNILKSLVISRLFYYVHFIKTWTIRDVLKRTTANQNNLNYLEFFNLKEFMIWFNTIK